MLCLAFAYALEWTPIGRHIVFVGPNREVARLVGINVNRIRAGSYIMASIVAALAGIMPSPRWAVSTPLPRRATCARAGCGVPRHRGRGAGSVHPIGTLIGIYFLETGIIGLQILGYSGWMQDAC